MAEVGAISGVAALKGMARSGIGEASAYEPFVDAMARALLIDQASVRPVGVAVLAESAGPLPIEYGWRGGGRGGGWSGGERRQDRGRSECGSAKRASEF